MGRSHAKNNTTQANLTHYERSLLRRDGAARRIGNDSMKPLDHCNLCLSRATLPVACTRAHVYCTECVLSDLVSQRAGIDAQRAELARWEAEDARKRDEARDAARARVLADFERGMGLAAAKSVRGGGVGASIRSGEERSPSAGAGSANGVGAGIGARAFDDEAVDAAARQAEDAALARIEAEESEGRKAKLAAFWLPSLAPEAPLGPLKDVKLQPLCHVGGTGGAHPLSRKTLLPVVFTYPGKGGPACPSCHKELNNATGAVLLTSTQPAGTETTQDKDTDGRKKKKAKKNKPEAVCGHVVCRTCTETVVKPSKACPVCEAGIDADGALQLGREGTGFAAAGGAIVKKATVAFRV